MIIGALFAILGLLLTYPYVSDALRSPPKDPLIGPAIAASMIFFGLFILALTFGRYRFPIVPIIAGGSFLFGFMGIVYAIQETFLNHEIYTARGWYAPVMLIEGGLVVFALWAIFLAKQHKAT